MAVIQRLLRVPALDTLPTDRQSAGDDGEPSVQSPRWLLLAQFKWTLAPDRQQHFLGHVRNLIRWYPPRNHDAEQRLTLRPTDDFPHFFHRDDWSIAPHLFLRTHQSSPSSGHDGFP
jgi:hypothetical protein